VKLNTCNVGKVLNDVIKVLTNEIYQKRLHIDYSAVSGLNLPIQEEKLRIVLYNLLTNAIKYSHQGGTIEVYQKDKSLFIRDYGKGIPSELIGQLMKKIMNSKAGTLHEKGTGLGMFLVGRILTDESIRVRYHETRNAGTLVSVGI
jgi:two-component system, sensor histidine kinase and response regulator